MEAEKRNALILELVYANMPFAVALSLNEAELIGWVAALREVTCKMTRD
jgi:hypothetical protein